MTPSFLESIGADAGSRQLQVGQAGSGVSTVDYSTVANYSVAGHRKLFGPVGAGRFRFTPR